MSFGTVKLRRLKCDHGGCDIWITGETDAEIREKAYEKGWLKTSKSDYCWRHKVPGLSNEGEIQLPEDARFLPGAEVVILGPPPKREGNRLTSGLACGTRANVTHYDSDGRVWVTLKGGGDVGFPPVWVVRYPGGDE